ncbi:MAG TPA: serine/threonine-protein kinase [Gemmataceae bacterium]|nr:serine/threonine-protein kinase [Gemmataceae bacterium]
MGLFGSFKKLFAARPKGALPRIDVRKRFDLLGRTGQGSMSKVWRARDKSLGRTVCLKLLDKEKTIKFEARFPGLSKPREGAICTQLRHKNIVQTFEWGMTTENEYYLVMELIEGLGLNYLIETHSPQLEGNRVKFLAQMADSLEYIHKQGFLHRDICPRNVMVTKEGLVKMIDFGLTIPNTPAFWKAGNRTGTPNYLAPELIRRVPTDLRVDLFALGVTAYEVFTHDLPWERTQSLQTLLSHLNTAPKDPRELRRDLDKPTTAFLLKAVERDPNLRFQTAGEFRDALLALPKQDW